MATAAQNSVLYRMAPWKNINKISKLELLLMRQVHPFCLWASAFVHQLYSTMAGSLSPCFIYAYC
jgi:hypothetical protein